MTASPDVDDLRVGVLGPVAAAQVARHLSSFLITSGVCVVESESAELDVLVVLLAPGIEELWEELRTPVTGGRLVVVQLDGYTGAPEQLAEVNWIPWRDDAPEAASAAVLVSITLGADTWRTLRQLRDDTTAWERSDRSTALLVHDIARAQEYADVVRSSAERVDQRRLGDDMRDYVTESLAVATSAHRRSTRRRWGLTALLAVATVAAAILVPAIANARRTNWQALVTNLGDASARQQPEWTGILAGALLINGTEEQRVIARTALRESLQRPWTLNNVDLGTGYSVENAWISDDRSTGWIIELETATRRSSLVRYDIRRGAVVSRIDLGGFYLQLGMSEDGSTAVVGGDGGFAVVDTRAGRVERTLPVDGELGGGDIVFTADHRAVVATGYGRLLAIPLEPPGPVTEIARYATWLDVQLDRTGTAVALMKTRPGHYAMVRVGTSAVVIAEGDVPEAVLEAGGLSFDASRAYVAGTDRQLWMLSPGHAAVPTGIATLDRTTIVRPAADDRLLIGGDVQRVHALDLPSGRQSAVVCREVPRVGFVQVSHDGRSVACVGAQQNAFWPLPERAEGPATDLDTADDARLLDLLRARISGCLSERQLTNVDSTTREQLGANVCVPATHSPAR
jgi:hypothetical protein